MWLCVCVSVCVVVEEVTVQNFSVTTLSLTLDPTKMEAFLCIAAFLSADFTKMEATMWHTFQGPFCSLCFLAFRGPELKTNLHVQNPVIEIVHSTWKEKHKDLVSCVAWGEKRKGKKCGFRDRKNKNRKTEGHRDPKAEGQMITDCFCYYLIWVPCTEE